MIQINFTKHCSTCATLIFFSFLGFIHNQLHTKLSPLSCILYAAACDSQPSPNTTKFFLFTSTRFLHCPCISYNLQHYSVHNIYLHSVLLEILLEDFNWMLKKINQKGSWLARQQQCVNSSWERALNFCTAELKLLRLMAEK